MKVAKNIHELIGNTPMIEITQFDLPRESGYLLNWNMLIQEEV